MQRRMISIKNPMAHKKSMLTLIRRTHCQNGESGATITCRAANMPAPAKLAIKKIIWRTATNLPWLDLFGRISR